jgi:hypothetical protein
MPLRIDHQIGRLDVAVNNAFLVSMFKRLGRLEAHPGHVAEIGAVAG